MKKSVFFISTNSSRVFPFFLFCLFFAAKLSAATWYVKPNGSDAGAGNSWAAAYQTLTKALQSAASGDQIWVAAGIYKPTTGTDRTISFSMINGVAILGGFPATGNPVLADRDWVTNVTTLSGDIGTAGDNSDNSYHVVYSALLNNTAILDGFVVMAGNANGAQPYNRGGGLKNVNSSPTIQYCSFYGNSAVAGGGVSNFINSSAIFNHCNFSNNSAISGGAMYNYTAAPTVKNCSFSGNSASGSYGAVYNHTSAAPEFINCIFYSNTAATNATAVGTTFSSVTLTNCSISGNSGGGACIYNLSSTATIKNCNIWGNSSSIGNIDGTTTVSYSNVQGGYTGTGNSNVNPLFVNAPGDLRLQACSPVINKGSDAAVPNGVTTDLDGNNRFFGTVDMGAYEYQGNPPGPVAICKNITVQLDATGNVSIPASAVDNGSTGCNLSMYLSKTNFNCSNVGANNLLFVVSDNNFHSSSCAVTVTVQDNTVPTVVCKNATVQLDATGNVTVPASAVDNGSADACGIASLTLSHTTFNCTNVSQAVTLTVTDNHGKTATCATVITVQDKIAPTALCKNATVQLDATGNVSVPASAVNNVSTDACGIATLTLSKTNFNCTNVGNVLVSLEVKDNNGNKAYCSTTLTVQDNIAPTAVCKNATVQLDATGNVTVPASAVNNGSTDACGIASLSLSKTTFDCSNIGANAVTLTVTDNNGKTATCSATVTVQDNVVPTAVCQNTTVQLDAGGNANLAPAAVNNGSADACGIASLSLSKTTFDCSNIGANSVTLTVTDHSGKTATCSATVTMQDNTLPTIICPGATTVTCSSNVPVVNLAAVTASDNCEAPAKSHIGDATSNQTCANRKTVTRTYRATDGSGNSTTCSQVITVFDNAKPNFTSVPANVTVQCNSIPAVGTATATDGCGGAVTVAYIGQTTEAGACSDAYTITRQWTATDGCGNTKTATQQIKVVDTQKPNFTGIPANITVQCDAIPAPATPAATDNCDASVAVTYNGQTQTNGSCPNAYSLTRTWIAADNCGNTRTMTQRITVVDNGKPVFTTFPANATITCGENPPAVGSPTASDGCGVTTVTYLGQSSTSGSCPGNYQINRSWRATDACGNSTAATQTIQVVDNGVPVFTSVPAPLTIECGEPLPPLVNPTATDACGGYIHITFLGNAPSGSGCATDYSVTRTWEAEDLCGNTTTATQVITVLGNNYGEENSENRDAVRQPMQNGLPQGSPLRVQPNPTTDRVWVDLSDFAEEAVIVSVFGDLGQLIWENRIPAVEELKFSLSLREVGAATGMYTLSVRNADRVATKRLVLVE